MGEKEDDVFWRRQPSLYEFETNPLEAKFSRVAVIGAGSVGAACASNLILLKTCSEVIMVDIDEERCEGEVLDLEDAGFISGVRCKKGTFEDAGSADIIVITAGVGQKPGESRVKLIEKNKSILKSIFDSMKPLNQEAIVLVVANPVDILTYLAQRLSGLSKHQVFGSGTFLDTQRFCRAVSGKLKVSTGDVDVFVLGEHGDSQFAATSCGSVGGVPLTSFPEITEEFLMQAEDNSRQRAYNIIQKKGATYHGVAACVATMVESIFLNNKCIFPLSVLDKEADVCISLPSVLGRDGVERVLPIRLNKRENEAYDKSVASMREVLDQIDLGDSSS